MHSGRNRQIIADAVSTRTLVAKESDALCLFDRAAGVVYTLPAPVIGMQFTFAVTVSRTSNAHKIITDAATTFLVGSMLLANTGATTGQGFAADGTTIRAVSSNGTTTGGLIGDRYTVTCISSTQWLVEGTMTQTGTAATPFATS
jgi:hypothetical protein